MLGIVVGGDWQPASWTGPARAADAADAKGIVEWLVSRVGAGRVEFAPTEARAMVEHRGLTAEVHLASDSSTPIGRVGELDPRYLRAYEIRSERVAFATLELEPLLAGAAGPSRVDQLARLPVVERDLAVVVGEHTPQARVADVIRGSAGPSLASLALFDRYTGPPLAVDQVSLAYRLRFQPSAGGVAEAELDEIVGRIVAELERSLGAKVRGADGGV